MSFEVGRADIADLALGSSLLACGGGGNPYYAQLIAERVIPRDRRVRVIDVEEMDPRSLAITCIGMGAPLVGLEKPPSLIALRAGYEAVRSSIPGRIGGFVAAEVGGAQSVLPLLLAAENGLPLLDGDGMGRAFPEAQMCTFLIYGMTPGVPAALSDDHGLLWRAPASIFPMWKGRIGGVGMLGPRAGVLIERAFRRYCVRKGGLIYVTASFDRSSLERTLVRGSIRSALELGRAVRAAQRRGDDPVDAMVRASQGRLLLNGKIIDVERRFRAGHDWGTLRIEGLQCDRGRRAEIAFKNEHLILWVDGQVVLTVPDLISPVETETGTPITTDIVRPGLRVSVVGMRSSPLLRTPEALRAVGPQAFGYEVPFVSLESTPPRSESGGCAAEVR